MGDVVVVIEGGEARCDDEGRCCGDVTGEGSDEFVVLVGGEGAGDVCVDEAAACCGVVKAEGDCVVADVDPEEVVVVGAGERFVGEVVEGWGTGGGHVDGVDAGFKWGSGVGVGVSRHGFWM